MAAFIKFDGVDGEAKSKHHKGWSVLAFFSQSIHQPGGGSTGSSRRRGAAILDDIVVNKKLDKASLTIAEALLTGKVFPEVEIEVTASYSGAGKQTYYRYELKNVIITSYSVSGSAEGREVPMEEVALNFEEIKVTYTERNRSGNSRGNVEYSWKVEEGRS
jgi:type VI secretion system secreted protein Hcp